MEHASFGDQRNATFSLDEEDHTLANALRFTLTQDPRVIFSGYNISHPSKALVNVRVQTMGEPAREVLKNACQDLMLMCQHIRGTFDKAVNDYCSSFRFIRPESLKVKEKAKGPHKEGLKVKEQEQAERPHIEASQPQVNRPEGLKVKEQAERPRREA
ncbi:DNA-directed RNA polymerases I and III subunit RPAC2-like [Eucalyptus grandis]|uniref:DNA-directed RNA polymerases I and III subunit RPAC2-like n=1 Tax=Eucalyptus grandis TaxID=71139 RepID=UPI00192EB584|nr:DNA-directed RNA polymerases I and III subunit RPAC2-like [Eucalyptus grandis]